MAPVYLDLEHFKNQTAGDAVLGREVLGLFTNQINQWMKLLSAPPDAQAWYDAAHAMLGSARGVGAVELAAICEQAEAADFDDLITRRMVYRKLRDVIGFTTEEAARLDYRLSLKELREQVKA